MSDITKNSNGTIYSSHENSNTCRQIIECPVNYVPQNIHKLYDNSKQRLSDKFLKFK